MKRYLLGSIIIALALVCGCINLEQETFLDEDMSGKVQIHVYNNKETSKCATAAYLEEVFSGCDSEIGRALKETLIAATANTAFRVKIDEGDLSNSFCQDAIKNKKYRQEDIDGNTHAYLEFEFDDITKIYKNEEQINIVSSEEVIKYIFTSDVKGVIGEAISKNIENSEKKESPELKNCIFKDCRIKYVLHMPGEIIDSNASEISGDTAIWTIPLQEAFEKEQATTFFATAPSPSKRNK
ncbi:MAG: hypothetical protein JW869_03760 [Candidatus Omnitrophica bacterium]|nr:hypothetical protein [Candidatus Omnitrophota bacterium]